jgi:hypothetical protein
MAELPGRDAALLLDMLIAARDARSFIEGMDESEFLASRLHQNAVIRSLEVIGEAAGREPNFCWNSAEETRILFVFRGLFARGLWERERTVPSLACPCEGAGQVGTVLCCVEAAPIPADSL